MPEPSRHGARMRVMTPAGRERVTDVAPDGSRNADGQVEILQEWRLFDVQFVIRLQFAQVDRRPQLAGAQAAADRAKVLGKRLAGVISAQRIEVLTRELAEQQFAAEIGLAEPRTFLAPEADHANAGFGRHASIKQAEHGKTRDHPGEPVVVAADRHRVEMGAEHDPRRIVERASRRDVKVAGRVGPRL